MYFFTKEGIAYDAEATMQEVLEQDWKQYEIPDSQKIRDIILRAKGPDKKLSDFAIQIGISNAKMSRIINNNFTRPIDKTILFKIVENGDYRSEKEKGEALYSLFIANGLRINNYINNKKTIKNLELVNERKRVTNQIFYKLLSLDYQIQKGFSDGWKKNPFPNDLDDFKGILHASHDEKQFSDFLYISREDIGNKKIYFCYDLYASTPKDYGLYNDGTFNMEARIRGIDIRHDLSYYILFSSKDWCPELFVDIHVIFVVIDKELYNNILLSPEFKVDADISIVLWDLDLEEPIEEYGFTRIDGSVPNSIFQSFEKNSISKDFVPPEFF